MPDKTKKMDALKCRHIDEFDVNGFDAKQARRQTAESRYRVVERILWTISRHAGRGKKSCKLEARYITDLNVKALRAKGFVVDVAKREISW